MERTRARMGLGRWQLGGRATLRRDLAMLDTGCRLGMRLQEVVLGATLICAAC